MTELLQAWVQGDPSALDRLMPIVYEELRLIAHHQLIGETPGHTLDTTGLVHECYLKLFGMDSGTFDSRRQFFALAATAMRHILIDLARKRSAQKRGAGAIRAEPGAFEAALVDDVDELLALDQALTRLGREAPRLVHLVECRFFAGMTTAETAEALGISPRTVERDWVRAKTYLYRELEEPNADGAR